MEKNLDIGKVVLVTNMLPPYRIAFYERLAKATELTVISDRVNSRGRQWNQDLEKFKFKFKVLKSRAIMLKRNRDDLGYKSKRPFNLSFKVFSELRRQNPDVVITIEYGLKTLWSLLYAKLYSKKIVLWSEGTLHTEATINWIRRLLRNFITPKIDMFWTNGIESSELVRSYGSKNEAHIEEGMTGVNTDWWIKQASIYKDQKSTLRLKFGIEGKAILVNGSLIPRKGVTQLLRALDSWDTDETFSVIFLGTGVLEEEIRDWFARQEKFKLIMPGFIDPSEMPQYMAAADWAALPTLDDNWPLAVLEVMLAGLPQLFSLYNGGSVDLCRSGENGYIFDPLNEDGFVEALKKINALETYNIPDEIINEYAQKYSPESMSLRAISSLRLL